MTQLLETAIAALRALPETEHDWAADNIRMIMRERERNGEYRLTQEQVAEVRRRRAALRDGTERLATDEETAAFWDRYGL